MKKTCLAIFILLLGFSLFAEELKVVVAEPQGLVEETRDYVIQIVFSDDMIDPFSGDFSRKEGTPEYIEITPPIEVESFFVSSTLLMITPKKIDELPFLQTYTVRVKKGAKSFTGKVLKDDYIFSFTTSPPQMLSVHSFKLEDKPESKYLIGIIFDRNIKEVNVEEVIKISTKFYKEGLSQSQDLNFISIVSQFDAEWLKNYTDWLNTLEDKANKYNVLFTIENKESKEAKEFIEKSLKHSYRFLKNNFVIFRTNDPIPPQSVIEIKVKGARNQNSHYYNKYVLTEPAYYFKGINGVIRRGEVEKSKCEGLLFSKELKEQSLIGKVKVIDIESRKEANLSFEESFKGGNIISLETIGFEPEVGKRYLFCLSKDIESEDGEKLCFDDYSIIEFKYSNAYLSFGEEVGVWESERGSVVPFYVKNVAKIKQKLTKVSKDEIVNYLLTLDKIKTSKILEGGEEKGLKGLKPEIKYNWGLDLKDYLNSSKKGVVFAEVEILSPIPQSKVDEHYYYRPQKSLIQVTDLAISLKYSPNDFLVYVNSFSKGGGVSNCQIEIRDFKNNVIFQGQTDQNGFLHFDKRLIKESDYSPYYSKEFVVIAFKDDDLAFLVNDWSDGIEPWRFDIPYEWNLSRTKDIYGIIFTDREVYKLGEKVNFKVILRKVYRGDFTPLDEGSEVELTIEDPMGKVKLNKKYKTSDYGSFDGDFTIGKEWRLGEYITKVTINNQDIYGRFLVAAYRKPDFRVNVQLEEKEKKVEALVEANYLFGSEVAEGDVNYIFEEWESFSLPKSISQKYKDWAFRKNYIESDGEKHFFVKKEGEGKLDKNGKLKLTFDTEKKPFTRTLSFEAEVKDITRQSISNSSSITIFPDYFVGIYYGDWSFKSFTEGLKSKVILIDKNGNNLKDKTLTLELYKIVYKSSRYMTGDYYYDWDSTKEFEKVATKTITTGDGINEVFFELNEGGHYLLKVKYEENGLTYIASDDYYFFGEGYTPWRRTSDNTIELLSEKSVYKVGEKAKIFVASPWEDCEMLITKERENIRSYELRKVKSTQEVVEIPIEEKDIPNVFVSVVLFKKRMSENQQDKPEIKIGYVQLKVENTERKLNVAIATDKDEYKPKEKIKVKVSVTNYKNEPQKDAEITLWAVDVGVLSLTNYLTPDPIESFYEDKILSVVTADSRGKLVSARVNEPKGEEEGGGGGIVLKGLAPIRKDFRAVAFYVSKVYTDENGVFEGEYELPENLSTFRIMAVVHTKSSLFGNGEKEFMISKSLFVTPYFPRFLNKGDKAFCGVLLSSRKDEGGKVKVKAESLTPKIIQIENGESEFEIKPKERKEFKFNLKSLSFGEGIIRVSVVGLNESDAFEIAVPVIKPYTFNFGSKKGKIEGREVFEYTLPKDVAKEIGELRIDLSKTIISELKEAYYFTITYPYGCAEQRSSILYSLLNNYKLAKEVGVDEAELDKAKKVIKEGLRTLEPFQNLDGGFSVWQNDEISLPYLSAYISNLLIEAKKENLLEDEEMFLESLNYLEKFSKECRLDNAYRYTNSQSLALMAKVLSENGKNVDYIISRLLPNLSSLPTLSLCHLWDAVEKSKKKEISVKIREILLKRMKILPNEAYIGKGFSDKYEWYWDSDAIATSATLLSFLKNGGENVDDITEKLAYYLINAIRKYTYYNYNTHLNSYLFAALSEYAKRELKDKKPLKITFKIEGENILEAELKKENGFEYSKTIPVSQLYKYGKDKLSFELISKGGKPFHYSLLLKTYNSDLKNPKETKDFDVERKYVDFKTKEEKNSFKGGDLVEVIITLFSNNSHYNVVLIDPLPAGLEIVDSSFKTTAQRLYPKQTDSDEENRYYYSYSGFNHIEKYDDHIALFADYLMSGRTIYRYLCRATTMGEYLSSGTKCSEMYNEQEYGKAPSTTIKIE